MANKKYIVPEILRGKLNKTIEYHDKWCEETRAELNENKTHAEKQVCQYLTKEGIEFIENFPIYIKEGKKYFIDFVLPGNIALEIDGGYHFTDGQIEKDRVRDEDLTSIGYKVVRLLNQECKSKKSFFTNFNVEYKAPSEKKRFDKFIKIQNKESKNKTDRLRRLNKKLRFYSVENDKDKNWGVVLHKNVFDLLIDGDLTNDEFCKLMKCIYNYKEKGEMPDQSKLPPAVNMLLNMKYPFLTSSSKINESVANKKIDFSKLSHLVFDCKELGPSERFMLLFIIESCNQHRYEGEYVGIPRADFANFLGIVDDKKYYRVRNSLVNLGLIDVKQGGRGNATKFKVLYDNIFGKV